MSINQNIIDSLERIRNSASTRNAPVNNDIISCLKEVTDNICRRQQESLKSIDALAYKTKLVNVELSNLINEFHLIANQQFVENRVYEEDITDLTSLRSGSTYNSSSTSSTTIDDSLDTKGVLSDERNKSDGANISLSSIIEKSLQFVGQRFVVQAQSDDDISSKASLHSDHEHFDLITLPNANRYSSRKLPYLIGSEEYIVDNLVGLDPIAAKDMSHEDVQKETIDSSRDLGEYISDEEDSFEDEFASMSAGPTISTSNFVPVPSVENEQTLPSVEQKQRNSPVPSQDDHEPLNVSNYLSKELSTHITASTPKVSTNTLHQSENSFKQADITKTEDTQSDNQQKPDSSSITTLDDQTHSVKHLDFQRTLQDQLSKHLLERSIKKETKHESQVKGLKAETSSISSDSIPRQPSPTALPIETHKIIAPKVAPRRSLSVTSSLDDKSPQVKRTEPKPDTALPKEPEKTPDKDNRISSILKKYSELFEDDDSDSSSDNESSRIVVNSSLARNTKPLDRKPSSGKDKFDDMHDSDDSSGSDLFVKKHH